MLLGAVPTGARATRRTWSLLRRRTRVSLLSLLCRAAAMGLGDLVSEAIDLYGLIHARFILTPRGVPLMLDKYHAGLFGSCPRFHCQRQHVLPVGLSERLHERHVMLFCPRCEDVYELGGAESAMFRATVARTRRLQSGHAEHALPYSDGDSSADDVGEVGPRCPPPAAGGGAGGLAGLDGAFFGPSFPHYLILHVPDQVLPPRPRPGDHAGGYVPRIYGFRVHNQRGPVRRDVGDSRGLYATTHLSELSSVGDRVGVATGTAAASSASGGRRSSAAAAMPAHVSVPRGSSSSASAAASEWSRPAGCVASGVFLPVPSTGVDEIAAGAPAVTAPLVWPVKGIPGGIPAYGDAVLLTADGAPPGSASSPTSVLTGAAGRYVSHGGVSYLVMRSSGVPLTYVYAAGEKPLEDDFTDGEGEPGPAPEASANRKRKRKT